MADIKISQLGSAITVDDSDIVPVVSGGNTLKATAAQLKEHAIGNTSISGIGNGSVTGAISALNTDKQPKTLATAITVDGTEQTTVEGALGAINTDLGSTKQALTNEKVTRALTGGHNLLPNNATSQVINGVTFTVNSDTKTIGANGTAQGGNANLFIIGTYTGTTSNAVLTFDKDIILSGGKNANVRVTAFIIRGSSGTVTQYSSEGNHVLIEANGEILYLLGVACQVLNGQTANNDGLYPMIRWATDEYMGYTPYAMTNRELTEKVTSLTTGTLYYGFTVPTVKAAGKYRIPCSQDGYV